MRGHRRALPDEHDRCLFLYLIKLHHPFACVEIGAGAVMAACFAFMWVVTLYQMWLMKPPEAILKRMGGDFPLA